MWINLKRFGIGALLYACVSLVVAGCGDYSGSGGGTGGSYQTVSGIASKGPIEGATVTVWQLVNGQKGAKLGETRSLADGSYRLTIPATSGPVVVEVRGNSTATYLNENNPAGPRVDFKDPNQVFRAAVPDISAAKTIAVTPLTEAAVKIVDASGGALTQAEKIKVANAQLSNLLGLDIVATLPNNIAVNQISDLNSSQDKYGAYLAGIQKLVTAINTVEKIINDIAAPIVANAPLGAAGTNFLSAVNAVISDPAINPTGMTALPDSITIQGAINVPVPVPEVDTTPPSAPTGLSAALDLDKTVRLTWSASTSADVTGYMVFRNGEVIGEVKLPGYYDISVVPSTTYSYTVKAFDGARNISAASNTAALTLPAAPGDTSPPSKVISLTASAVGSSSVTLIWDPATDNIGVAGYTVFRNGQKVGSVTDPGYTDQQAAANTLYRYQVQAFDGAGNTAAAGSEVTVFTLPVPDATDTQPPSAPGNLAVSGKTSGSVSLTWTASSDNVGVAGYRVYRDNQLLAMVTGAFYADAAAAASATYNYSVEAFDTAGNSSVRSSVLTVLTEAVQSPTDTQPPTTPAGLVSPGFTKNSVNLAWNASTDNIQVAGYNIYRGGVKIATVTQTAYSDTSVLAGTAYTYKVNAFDPTGNVSVDSNGLSITTLPESVVIDGEAPALPTGLAASGVTEKSISLTWTAATDNVGVVKYDIYRDGVKISSVTGASYTDAIGLQPQTAYRYKVKAFDAAGNASLFSAELAVTTLPSFDAVPPTTPGNLSASSITTTSLTLAWSASTDDREVVRYDIYRNGVKAGSTVGSIRTYADTALSSGATYKYKVQAFDAAGNGSSFSAELSVDTRTSIVVDVSGKIDPGIIGLPSLDKSPPTAPANLAATTFSTTATQSSVVLTWSPSTDDVGVTGYDVYRSGIKIVTVSRPGYTVTGVPSGVASDYLVIAFDAAGNRSPASNQLSVTPNQASLGVTVSGQLGSGITGLPSIDVSAPAAPANLGATTYSTSATQSSVVLTWNPSTDNVGVTGYEVYRGNSKVATVSRPGCTVTGVPSGTLSNYFVIAFDAAGNRSAASNQLSVTPNQASLGVTVSGQLGSGITGLPSIDVSAPGAPAGLAAATYSTSITQSSVALTWSPSTDNVGVAGYEVYRDGSKVATVTQPGYTVAGVPSGTLSNYFVIAFDAAGNRSVASNQLSVTPNQVSLGVIVGGWLLGP